PRGPGDFHRDLRELVRVRSPSDPCRLSPGCRGPLGSAPDRHRPCDRVLRRSTTHHAESDPGGALNDLFHGCGEMARGAAGDWSGDPDDERPAKDPFEGARTDPREASVVEGDLHLEEITDP